MRAEALRYLWQDGEPGDAAVVRPLLQDENDQARRMARLTVAALSASDTAGVLDLLSYPVGLRSGVVGMCD